jgi:hypothetical protein
VGVVFPGGGPVGQPKTLSSTAAAMPNPTTCASIEACRKDGDTNRGCARPSKSLADAVGGAVAADFVRRKPDKRT